MYIYNVTINIDPSVHEHWRQWMQEKHIPDMLATGKFIKALMSRVQVEEEMGGFTYSVQYTTESKEILNKYYLEDAEQLRNEALQLFPNKFVTFRTELEIVHQIEK
ncbi:MAG: DUF4286 family protein [Flavobacteriaceae bacterium]|nr:DUF4286 family protein [Flavobacteriaceae bacterium]